MRALSCTSSDATAGSAEELEVELELELEPALVLAKETALEAAS